MQTDNLWDYLKRYLSVQFLTLELSVIGIVAGIAPIFNLSQCHTCGVLVVLTVLCGGSILGYGCFRSSWKQHEPWDRVLTLVLYIIAVFGLGYLTYHTCCGNKCPEITLNLSCHQIPVGSTVNLTVEAEDPENDPLAYWWDAEMAGVEASGLEIKGGPYEVTENKYTAPPESAGESVIITVKVDDHACRKVVEVSQEIHVVHNKPPTPTSTPKSVVHATLTDTPTAAPTPSPTPADTPTATFTPFPTITGTPTLPIPTNTPGPTSTSTPSPKPTATFTPTPEPTTSTPTYTPTPIAKRVLEIELLEPAERANYDGVAQITFSWRLTDVSTPLTEKEHFALRIWHHDMPEERHSITWQKELSYILDLYNKTLGIDLSAGYYYWNVGIVHEVCTPREAPGCWESHYESETRLIYINKPEPSTPIPSPQPTHTPTPEPTPEE